MSDVVKNTIFSDAQYLDRVQALLGQSTDRLSAGTRILAPSDDPKGVGDSEKFTGQNRRVQAALTNVQNGQSMQQTKSGMLTTLGDIVSRMSELATMATDPTKSSSDISLYQTEFSQLQEQLRGTIGGTTAEIGGTTSITQPSGMFNGTELFGPVPGGTSVTVGASSTDTVTMPETNLRTGSMLSLMQQDNSGNFTFSLSSANALTTINDALSQVSVSQATVGAVSRRFDLLSTTLSQQSQDLTKAVSDIQDVNVATESTRLAKLQTLSQAATAMLAQANQAPQAVLGLLNTATIPGASH